MFGIAHAARFQHEEYNDGCAMTSKFSSQGLNAIEIAEILISTHACGTKIRAYEKGLVRCNDDLAVIRTGKFLSGALFLCEFPPKP